MTPLAVLGLALLGLLLAGMGASGSKLLRNFSPHDLEEYCERRHRQDRFDEILEHHEIVSLGADTLQMLGATLMLVCGTGWLLEQSGRTTASPSLLFSAFVVGSILLVIVTSWIPWAVTRIWSIPLLFHTWSFWSWTSKLMWPLRIGVHVLDAIIRRIAGRPEEETDDEEAFEDEIRTIVTAGHREGLLEADAREMIEGVIELGDTDVSDIMTPRSNVDVFEIGISWDELLQFVVRVGRTRIPVYEENLENIIGVLFVKDLLAELSVDRSQRKPLRELVRQAWFVPSTKPVDEMLKEFLSTRSHLAIVVDEYERMAGVVTIEDVLEEIVGEIVDESDRDTEQEITQINGTTADVLGTTHLDELNKRLGLDLSESDDYDTIAGLVLNRLGYVPKVGELVLEGPIQISVTEASKRKIDRVRIQTRSQETGFRAQHAEQVEPVHHPEV